MSLQQYFSETQAVVQILSQYIERQGTDLDGHGTLYINTDSEDFTALWQAVELLSRAYSVLLPMVQFEQSKAALNLPDVQREQPKPKKKAHLYGADGKPL